MSQLAKYRAASTECATACLTEVASIQAVRSRKYCVSVHSPSGISAAADAVCERTRSVERAGSGCQGHAERVQSSRGRKRTRLPGQSSALGRAELCKNASSAGAIDNSCVGVQAHTRTVSVAADAYIHTRDRAAGANINPTPPVTMAADLFARCAAMAPGGRSAKTFICGGTRGTPSMWQAPALALGRSVGRSRHA